MNSRRCNKCGKPLTIFDDQENFSIHSRSIGYGSKHDGERLDIILCCECMDELIDSCVINPCEDKNT